MFASTDGKPSANLGSLWQPSQLLFKKMGQPQPL